jgi:hypothetical protein
MTRNIRMLILLMPLLSAATGQRVSLKSAAIQARFAASNGDVIELNTRTGRLVTPHSRNAGLQDCSDGFQVCLTDHHGFAFAYLRKCDDASHENFKRLKFGLKVVSALHNSDVWLVFDDGAGYLFHYAYSRGIVGIYVGPTASFDFRSVLHDQNFRLSSLDAMEYRITGSDTVAACRQ